MGNDEEDGIMVNNTFDTFCLVVVISSFW